MGRFADVVRGRKVGYVSCLLFYPIDPQRREMVQPKLIARKRLGIFPNKPRPKAKNQEMYSNRKEQKRLRQGKGGGKTIKEVGDQPEKMRNAMQYTRILQRGTSNKGGLNLIICSGEMWPSRGKKREREREIERSESGERRSQEEDPSLEVDTTTPMDWAAAWQEMFPRTAEEQNQKRVMVVNNNEWEISVQKKKRNHETGRTSRGKEEKGNYYRT